MAGQITQLSDPSLQEKVIVVPPQGNAADAATQPSFKLSPTASVLVVMLLSVQITSGGLAISFATRYDKTEHPVRLTACSLVFIAAVMKMGVNVVAYSYDRSSRVDSTVPKFNYLYAVPSLLYTVSDNIAFFSLAKINPAVFALIWNCKTAFVAILMRVFLIRKPLEWIKWVGVGLLLVGPTLVELERKKEASKQEEAHGQLFYHVVCLCGAFVSACANVYVEWVLKKHRGDPLLWQNVQLFTCTCILSFCALVQQEGWDQALLLLDPTYVARALTVYSLFGVSMQAAQSFVVPVILKYMDNIADLYAHAGSTLLTAFCTTMFFDLELSAHFVAGLGCSCVSLFLYYHEKIIPHLAMARDYFTDLRESLVRKA